MGFGDPSGDGSSQRSPERPRHVGDCGTAERELHVVPRRRLAVAIVPEIHGLRVAVVARVIPPTVREVDAADERDVAVRGRL